MWGARAKLKVFLKKLVSLEWIVNLCVSQFSYVFGIVLTANQKLLKRLLDIFVLLLLEKKLTETYNKKETLFWKLSFL